MADTALRAVRRPCWWLIQAQKTWWGLALCLPLQMSKLRMSLWHDRGPCNKTESSAVNDVDLKMGRDQTEECESREVTQRYNCFLVQLSLDASNQRGGLQRPNGCVCFSLESTVNAVLLKLSCYIVDMSRPSGDRLVEPSFLTILLDFMASTNYLKANVAEKWTFEHRLISLLRNPAHWQSCDTNGTPPVMLVPQQDTPCKLKVSTWQTKCSKSRSVTWSAGTYDLICSQPRQHKVQELPSEPGVRCIYHTKRKSHWEKQRNRYPPKHVWSASGCLRGPVQTLMKTHVCDPECVPAQTMHRECVWTAPDHQ